MMGCLYKITKYRYPANGVKLHKNLPGNSLWTDQEDDKTHGNYHDLQDLLPQNSQL